MITSTKIPRLFDRVPPKWLYIAMFAVLMIAPHSCDMLSCHPSCATCSNSSVTGCLTCPPNKFLIPSNHTCVENCPSGYTGDIATKTCVAVTCHPSCATCSNSSETGCLTCPFYKYLLPLNHTCVSSCPSGYTGNFITKTCVAVTCHPSCATCSNSSANGCLTCPVNKFLLVSNHSCLESCPSGYTADLTTKTCVLITCHPSCATCSNSSETGCLTCPFYKYLLPLNHTCVSSCPSGYTGDFATKTCVAVTCHPSCATCSNSSANGCLTCPLYKFLLLSNHSCVSTCPSGYTGDIATKTCVLVTCHPSCATCSNSSETGCLTCPPYKFLIPSNHTCVSSCPSGYTGDYATKTCVAITCHPSCATCSNSSSNGCLTCPPYKFLIPSNHTCVSTCPSGYTGDIATKTCVAITCHPSCATCSNSSETGCLTCPFYKYLLPLNHTCVSSCPSGYTGDFATKTCVAITCHPSCATCSNSSATGCLTCPPYKFLIPLNHTCVSTCPSGYVGDYVTKTCVAITCHPSCATCSNSSATGCLTCPPYKFLIPSNHTCVSTCPSGYVGDYVTKTCVAITCHPSCATCSNSSATGCLTCPPYKFLIPSNHTCVSSCPSGYTGDYATKTCVAITCHPSCATCSNSSATGCLTCPPYKFLIPSNHTCVSTCPFGYVGDYVTKTCVLIPCHPSCATCSNSSATGCLTCPPYKFLIPSNHTCVSTCPIGYTGDLATKTCVIIPCHPSCATCSNSSATGCLTCPPYKFLIPSNHTCVSTCPIGYVGDYVTKTCVLIPCHPSCATCSNSSATGCLTCPLYKFLIPSNHSCVATCPVGYIANYTTKTCVPLPCHPSCATCSNSSANGCLTCPPNRLFLAFNNSCVKTCPPGWYASGNVCVACHSSCATCSNSSANGCLSCSGNRFLNPNNNKCVLNCPAGWYGSNNLCVACHSSCATCSNSTAKGCLTCPPNRFLLQSNHSCVKNCPVGYTENAVTRTCVLLVCHPSCATCSNSSATGCLTCPPYRFLIPSNHTCVSTCPPAWCGSGNVCVTCHPTCATCSNNQATGCLTCSGSRYLWSANHTCLSSCPAGYYGDSATHTCKPCDRSCYTCSNGSSNGCLSCSSPLYFLAANHSCSVYCPRGTIPNKATRVCDPIVSRCHPSCATCSGSGEDQCLTCASSFPVKCGGYCQVQCPGSWVRNQWVCHQCHASCRGCASGARNCLLCASGYTRVGTTGPCIPSQKSRRLRE